MSHGKPTISAGRPSETSLSSLCRRPEPLAQNLLCLLVQSHITFAIGASVCAPFWRGRAACSLLSCKERLWWTCSVLQRPQGRSVPS
jgi:hypothetical protein